MPESEISDTHTCIPGDEPLTVTAWHSLTNKVKGFHLGWDLGGGRGGRVESRGSRKRQSDSTEDQGRRSLTA